jgi:hypothetical protein
MTMRKVEAVGTIDELLYAYAEQSILTGIWVQELTEDKREELEAMFFSDDDTAHEEAVDAVRKNSEIFSKAEEAYEVIKELQEKR